MIPKQHEPYGHPIYGNRYGKEIPSLLAHLTQREYLSSQTNTVMPKIEPHSGEATITVLPCLNRAEPCISTAV